MRTLSADTKDVKIRELIEAAHKGPVTLLENGARAAVVLSPTEFDRLDEQDRIRREAKERLRQTISAMQKEAADRGLTETELERLLADESCHAGREREPESRYPYVDGRRPDTGYSAGAKFRHDSGPT